MRRLSIVLIALAAIAAACAPLIEDNANGGLVNTSWTVLSIAGAPTLAQARPTMTFGQDATVSGSAGCNQYSGAFRTDGDAIIIGEVSSTLIGCDGDRGGQEGAFLMALQGANRWRQEANGNLVISGAGDIVAAPGVAEGPPGDGPVADLPGTAWSLIEMGGTADFAELVPTIEFGADGSVSGFAGCNRFSGSYMVTGGQLAMEPIAATKMGCEPPASAVESAYLTALAGLTDWSIGADGRLTLNGPVPLTFAPG